MQQQHRLHLILLALRVISFRTEGTGTLYQCINQTPKSSDACCPWDKQVNLNKEPTSSLRVCSQGQVPGGWHHGVLLIANTHRNQGNKPICPEEKAQMNTLHHLMHLSSKKGSKTVSKYPSININIVTLSNDLMLQGPILVAPIVAEQIFIKFIQPYRSRCGAKFIKMQNCFLTVSIYTFYLHLSPLNNTCNTLMLNFYDLNQKNHFECFCLLERSFKNLQKVIFCFNDILFTTPMTYSIPNSLVVICRFSIMVLFYKKIRFKNFV